MLLARKFFITKTSRKSCIWRLRLISGASDLVIRPTRSAPQFAGPLFPCGELQLPAHEMHAFGWGSILVSFRVSQISITAACLKIEVSTFADRRRETNLKRLTAFVDEPLLALVQSNPIFFTQRVNMTMFFSSPINIQVLNSPENREPGGAWVPPWSSCGNNNTLRALLRFPIYFTSLQRSCPLQFTSVSVSLDPCRRGELRASLLRHFSCPGPVLLLSEPTPTVPKARPYFTWIPERLPCHVVMVVTPSMQVGPTERLWARPRLSRRIGFLC